MGLCYFIVHEIPYDIKDEIESLLNKLRCPTCARAARSMITVGGCNGPIFLRTLRGIVKDRRLLALIRMSERIVSEGRPVAIQVVRSHNKISSHFSLNPRKYSTTSSLQRFTCMYSSMWSDLSGKINFIVDSSLEPGVEFLLGVIYSLEDPSKEMWIRSIFYIIRMRSEFKRLKTVLNDEVRVYLTVLGCMVGKVDDTFLHVHYDFRGACKLLDILHILRVPSYGYCELAELEEASVLCRKHLLDSVPKHIRFVRV